MRFATPADTAAFGEYAVDRADPRPLYRITGRIGEDTAFTPRPYRYHVYGGRTCPWSQRVAITRGLAGLTGTVSMSYVDDRRDGRGWAFRAARGPDPVNGFRLLREAYEATEDGFDGHVSVPALWDRRTAQLVSNDPTTIGLDLASRFPVSYETYPADRRAAIDPWLGPVDPDRARAALADSRFLVGDAVTEADVRVFVALIREPEAAAHPRLTAYLRDLWALPAFRASTDFAAIGVAPPAWSA